MCLRNMIELISTQNNQFLTQLLTIYIAGFGSS